MATTAAQRGRQLDRHAFAELVGYRTAGTITKNLSRSRVRREAGQTENLFPEPDGYLGRTPFWYQATAEAWIRDAKLGQGQAPGDGDHAASGPGNCPVCGVYQYGSVATHRRRKAACSFNPAVRRAALAVPPDTYRDEEVAQAAPGNCPCCGRAFKSVTSHRLQHMPCSFNPGIRAALNGSR